MFFLQILTKKKILIKKIYFLFVFTYFSLTRLFFCVNNKSHINKQTTYENPYTHQHQGEYNACGTNSHPNLNTSGNINQQQQEYQDQLAQMKTFKPAGEFNTANTNSPSSGNIYLSQQQPQPQSQQRTRNIYFTQNPHELKGS